MVYRHYRLPSLTALAAFEASARHRSIQRAADELNVTAGAVSRQIKALEEELGVPLFVRTPRGLTLTADAEALYAVLAQSFSRTAETVQIIRSGNRTERVTLACTHAFATQWLMPRMGDFWRRLPGDHRRSPDLRRRPGVPARRGRPAHPLRLRRLAGRDLGAADDRDDLSDRRPGFARRHAGCTAADIPDLPLLHVDWADADWTGWDELLRRAGIPHGALPGRRFGTLGVVLQACQEDQGVAVGWHRLVRPLVDAGRIVPLHRPADTRRPAPTI